MHSEQTFDQYLKQHHLQIYLTDLFRLLGSSAVADAVRLASDYLCAVVHGQHVQGREFSYVSATPWNRMTFLRTAKTLLEPIASHIGAFTLQDMHSLMLMVCSDIPLRIARSAFKAASPLLPSGMQPPQHAPPIITTTPSLVPARSSVTLLRMWRHGSAVPHLSGEVAKLAFPKLWTGLEVTFLFEHHLLELRHIAFEGKSHLLKGSEDVRACLEAVQATVCLSGWPSIPEPVLQAVVAQVADSLDQGAQRFHFDALVRGLCNSSEMREHLHAKMLELHQKQTNAPAVLAALTQSLDQQPLLDKTNTTLRSESAHVAPALFDVVDFCVEAER